MKLVLIGAPGCGKGTLAKGLINQLQIPTISTGDLLRNAIAEGSKVGKEAKSYMDKGQLVPTEVIFKLLKERLKKSDTKNGYILDGYPRTIEQAELLDSVAKIDKCLFLDVDKEIIVGRIAGRITCKKCGTPYNTRTYKKPTCECGGELIVRADDNPETVAKRFDVYTSQTAPLIDFYKNKGILKVVKGQDDPNETLRLALEQLK